MLRLRRAGPNLRQAHIFMVNIISLEVTGGTSDLDGIVMQVGVL